MSDAAMSNLDAKMFTKTTTISKDVCQMLL